MFGVRGGRRRSRLFIGIPLTIFIIAAQIALAASCSRCGSEFKANSDLCGVCGLEVPAERGHFFVSSVPTRAQVIHLGSPIGDTPIRRENLKTGYYNLLIRKDDYLPERIRILVRPGLLTTETVRLKRKPQEPTEYPPLRDPRLRTATSPPEPRPEPQVPPRSSTGAAGGSGGTRSASGASRVRGPRLDESSPQPSFVEVGDSALAAPAFGTPPSSLEEFFGTATGSVLASRRYGTGSANLDLVLDPSLLGAGIARSEGSAMNATGARRPRSGTMDSMGVLKIVIVNKGEMKLSRAVEVAFDGQVIGRPLFDLNANQATLEFSTTVPSGVHALELRARVASEGQEASPRRRVISVAISPGETTEVRHEFEGGPDGFALAGS